MSKVVKSEKIDTLRSIIAKKTTAVNDTKKKLFKAYRNIDQYDYRPGDKKLSRKVRKLMSNTKDPDFKVFLHYKDAIPGLIDEIDAQKLSVKESESELNHLRNPPSDTEIEKEFFKAGELINCLTSLFHFIYWPNTIHLD